jgi:hypothetical protein
MGNNSDPLTSFIIICNVLLGTGPIIVPPVFLLAGVGLSTIWTLITIFFSYYSAELIVESMSIVNALTIAREKEDRQSGIDQMSLPPVENQYSTVSESNNFSVSTRQFEST